MIGRGKRHITYVNDKTVNFEKLKAMKILLIEDDRILRFTLREVLEAEGYEVFEAADGISGIKAYESGKFNMVITDLVMPGKDGMEVISEVRKHDWNTKIIAMSGGSRFPANDFLLMATLLGADMVLPKPFEIKELIQSANELLMVSQHH